VTVDKTDGHCRGQPGGCTEFQLLQQEVKRGISPKLEEIDERTDKTETKVDGFEGKLNTLIRWSIGIIVTIIVGCGSIVAAIMLKG
jgi:hypothetical protein